MFEHQTQLELSEKDLCRAITIGLRDIRSSIRITGDVHVVAVKRGNSTSRFTIEITRRSRSGSQTKCPVTEAEET